MESVPIWQAASLTIFITWILLSSFLNASQRIRSFVQPWAVRQSKSGTAFILRVQKFQHPHLDCLFSGLSCSVSVPFYTTFLPLLFWSGHSKLARQMTLLMALCDYVGNCIKDAVSSPRPLSPPVRIVTSTKDEKENALEYGFPSSHVLNTVCFCGYLSHYVFAHTQGMDSALEFAGICCTVCLLVGLIGFGRIYLGMHCLADILGGFAIGVTILLVWLTVDDSVDSFVISGSNVIPFWVALSFLLLFAYPMPELPTPSFEYHAAFSGVGLGIVSGVQQTYHQFHHDDVARLFTHQLKAPAFVGRMMVGIPAILVVKFCCKVLGKSLLPVSSHMMGIPIRSSAYIHALKGPSIVDGAAKQRNRVADFFLLKRESSLDVDTGIRFLQYAGLAWSVVDLVPTLFLYLGL